LVSNGSAVRAEALDAPAFTMSTIVLTVIEGSDKGRVFELDGNVVTLGRSPSNEVQLGEPLVSGEHARIVAAADEVFVEDLGSTNGTALLRDGIRVTLGEQGTARAILKTGDILELGGEGDGSSKLRVTLDEEPEPEHVVSVRRIGDLRGHTSSVERNVAILKILFRVQ
jgi:Nif-specific regulatory protein